LLGQDAKAASNAPFNESVTQEIRGWNAPLDTNYDASPGDTFTEIDVSEPEFFDCFVDVNRVTEVIDHHPGNEQLWQDRLSDKATIEFIGAACTLVYEKWQAADKLPEISETSARLLMTGILDNTLNFEAGVTTERDRSAYENLAKYADLPADWPTQYFSECQRAIEADLATALKNDTKTMSETAVLPRVFGQIVIWNARELLERRAGEISAIMTDMDEDWGVNVISIGEGHNYFLATNPATQAKFAKLYPVEFQNDIAPTTKLLLRKEILKRSAEI
jgi:hypothetical protein